MEAAASSLPRCRCDQLVELRRGHGQNYHYRTGAGRYREDTPLRHVCYYSSADAWVPYEFCIGAHSANGPVPVVRREDFDEHGERVGDYP